MVKINLNVGDVFKFTKTIGESDVYLFAGITGDFTMHHIDEEYMKSTPFKTRIAHGALTLSFTSTTAGLAVKASGQTVIAYGYDKVRFIKPVILGDTVTCTYTIVEKDEEAGKTYAECKCVNQRGETALVAVHILKFFPDCAPPNPVPAWRI